MVQEILNSHIWIIAGSLLLIYIFNLYDVLFRVKKNTDNIDLLARYCKLVTIRNRRKK